MKSTLIKLVRGACGALLALALFGCATKMSPEERLALKRVSIGSIQLPEKPYVLSPGGGGAFLFGGALGLAVANASSDVPTALKDHVAKNNINIPSYVRSELVSQLRSKGIEVVDGDNRGDAVLVVQVLAYGLTGTLTSDDRFPLLQLRLSLLNKSGDRMWLGFASSNGIVEVAKTADARPIPDFFNDPRLLDREFRKVTNIVVSSAMKDL